MNSDYKNNAIRLAKSLFDYLYLQDRLSLAEAIIGFGHFDQKIPFQCGKLFSEGFAPLIIFSGGIGAGSAGLNKPEAHEFFDTLIHHFPELPADKVLLEDKSTNTGENIRFTLSLLKQKQSEIKEFKNIIIVANAYRQRRVWLTCKKYFENSVLLNCPPPTDFETELEMFRSKGEDFYTHLIDEMERIKIYPAKGYIAENIIPTKILRDVEELKILLQK